MIECIINKSFESSVERSSRVLECAEAFGLGLQSKEFVVYKDLKIFVHQGDVIYITGQSGSGKTLILKELASQISKATPVCNIEDVQLVEKPLIDQVGDSTSEAIRILSQAGLNDAYLFIRKPSQLWDGQLYRFKIAKLLDSGAKVIVADEFGAVLDRVTARAVALSVQKFARSKGATLIVATTHGDLKQELAPDLYINKRFQEKIAIEYPPVGERE